MINWTKVPFDKLISVAVPTYVGGLPESAVVRVYRWL